MTYVHVVQAKNTKTVVESNIIKLQRILNSVGENIVHNYFKETAKGIRKETKICLN